MSDRPTSSPGDSFDFDGWATLAKEDPEAFEAAREAELQALIDAAPERIKRRLQGLQWQVDCVRKGTDNPMSVAVQISNMMWNKVVGEGGLLDALDGYASSTTIGQVRQPAAQVLTFPMRDESQDATPRHPESDQE